MIGSKKCFKCGIVKDLDSFYKHEGMADGRLNKCKECNKKDVSKNYRDNVEHYKEYEKTREEDDSRKADKKKTQSKHREQNPEKYKARTALGNALRDGRIIKRNLVITAMVLQESKHIMMTIASR